MPTATTALTVTDVSDSKKNGAFFDALASVPLGNSKFQTQKFTFNHATPSRNYRQALLQLRQDVRALVNAQGHRRKEEVRIRRLEKLIAEQQKILSATGSTADEKFEAQCVIDESQADIEVSTFELRDQQVLEADAVERIKSVLEVFNKLPKISRTEFEASEQQYWTARFMKEATAQLDSTQSVNAGLIEAMKDIGLDPKKTLGNLPSHMIRDDGRNPKLLDSPSVK